MLQRLLYTPEGAARPRRMALVLGVLIAIAVFGSGLLVLTPSLSDDEAVRTAWVLFCVFLLKFPLIGLLWWFIARNREWPGRPTRWSPEETREILAHLVAEAERSRDLPDAPARLAYLQREAWNVADRAEGDPKVDAVGVALRIDQMQVARAPRRRPAAD